MNKTVNINLGGLYFHIDENAFQKMSNYLDAIKGSLTNSTGQDEIINDIEMRISELLTEKQKTEKHVVTIKEVDEVIAVMGQPEDYKIEDNETEKTAHIHNTTPRKLYRDKDEGIIGGVLVGLGHFLGIDTVWLRIAMLILVFLFGTGIAAYIILWIAIPQAVTTAEKLEMKGKPVNISNIEKKVREEIENVSGKIKNADYDKMGNQIKTNAERISSTISDLIMALFRAFSKILGLILIIIGLIILSILFAGIFTLESTAIIGVPWRELIKAANFTEFPIWTIELLWFFAIGIPFFFLSALGFKLLSPTAKSIGKVVKYTLVAIWITSIAIISGLAIQQVQAFSEDGRTVQKEKIYLKPNDTITIKFKHNEFFTNNLNDYYSYKTTLDSVGSKKLYSNHVHIKIAYTEQRFAYIQIEKEAKGKTLLEAKKRAEKIEYHHKLINNQLVFDNYLLTDASDKFRDQKIEIILYLPNGTLLQMDESASDYIDTSDGYFGWNPDNTNAIYKIEEDEIKCINCFDEEVSEKIDKNIDEIDQEKNQSTKTVKVNIGGFTFKKTTNETLSSAN